MPVLRFKAMEDVLNRKVRKTELPSIKTSDYYGINVFNQKKMQSYLSKEAYQEVMDAIKEGKNPLKYLLNLSDDGSHKGGKKD